ncbi:BCCT family transporter [Oceanobacillus luteolus]|uniref:BCCT family transporter n=1 Tax=Oceanobacillus luteolus TaxID=1274358 RepID=A0ABW4HNM2_9BACI
MKKNDSGKPSLDWTVFALSGGFFVLFIIAYVINRDLVGNFVNDSFAFSVKYFGSFWQILLLATFILAIIIAFSKYGDIRLGKQAKPDMGYFRWAAIIGTTLMAAGGIFWAAAEPMYHFLSTPPFFGDIESGTAEAVSPALAQSFLHWGFLSWAINGTLSVIILMYAHYDKGAPLKPRSLLYPIFGDKIMNKGGVGAFTDTFSIIAVAAGTIGPIGFLGLQGGYAFNALFGIPNNFLTHTLIIVGLVVVATISVVSGVTRGIQLLSRFNVLLVIVLFVFIFLLGPGIFIVNEFIGGLGLYLQSIPAMSTFQGAPDWLGGWTVFFFGWFLGYGPMMAVFVSSISRGRTIRELVLTIAVLAPLLMNFWFTVVGGTGIFYELNNPGVISDALSVAGEPAAMIAISQQLPLGTILSYLFLFSTIIFVITSADAMSLSISIAITGNDNPQKMLRAFWAIVMGLVAVILVAFGEGGIGALQSFIVATAVPVSILLFTNLWTAPKVVKELYKEHKQSLDQKEQVEEEEEEDLPANF